MVVYTFLSCFSGSYECGICGKKYKYYNCFQTHVRAHRGISLLLKSWGILGLTFRLGDYFGEGVECSAASLFVSNASFGWPVHRINAGAG